ncbi:MAG: peptidylprolyl isomerase [Thalassobius sp.]|nr:peptidylprolyl isomerase [Thalassovita sp.]
MKYMNRVKIFTAILFAVLFSSKLLAQGDGVIVDKIIAKVDNYIVLKSELENAYLGKVSNGEKVGPNTKCELLQQLIINKILLAKAEIDSIIVEPVMVESEIQRRMQYFVLQAGSEEKLEQTLGKKLSSLEDELRDQVQEQLTVQKMQQELTSGITVTPLQVKKFFNSLPKDSIPFLPAEVKVGQIVKFPEVNTAEKDKARAKLNSFKEQVLAEEADFAELARKYSEDFGSAKNGGDLGWHGRGELVPEFEATALRIEPGEIADPVESEFGFHLIQLLERRGNRFRARHILVRPKSNADDLKNTVAFMDSIRNMIQLDTMTFEEAAKEHSDDQETRSNAGFFKDNTTGSSFVSTESLDPVIFFTVDTMKVGNITAPQQFRTDDGKAAVRIIYYNNYIPPHYANLKEDYQKLYVATMNNKRGEVIDKWLQTAKSQVFIEIDPEYDKCDIIKSL